MTVEENPRAKRKSETDQRGKFECSKCKNTFSTKNSWIYHEKYQCGVPPRYQCSYCPYKSRKSANVKKHSIRMHKGRDPVIVQLWKPVLKSGEFPCPNKNCGRVYKLTDSLKYHLNYECGKKLPTKFKRCE
ncbi:zinc finger protein 878-like [Cotesia glomerata]|uniref:zinc finger protein 878-like n=1 Tax=Cotesia glomerata TaxID=32391 RepID=UPI001D00F535|nr:zinc finger protein 878-like [Cotesia glomerata]